jgi:hypothetical protein
MKIFIGPSGCDLVLEALKKLQRETSDELRTPSLLGTENDFFSVDALATKERNLRSLIGVYEALKAGYTDEDRWENLLWTAKEE